MKHKKRNKSAPRSARRAAKREAFRQKKQAAAKGAKPSKGKAVVSAPGAKAAKGKTPSTREFDTKANKLIQKGRDRGFVTYDEILKEFPQIENDILFLDELYSKFAAAN